MNGEREQAWEAEDRTGGLDVPGTRSDIGVGSEDREPGFGPTGAGTSDAGNAADPGAAGSLSDAAQDTEVEDD